MYKRQGAPLGARIVTGAFVDAHGSCLWIAGFSQDVDQLSGAWTDIQREQHHVVQLPELLAPSTEGEQLPDFSVIQDAQTPGVCFGDLDPTPTTAQDGPVSYTHLDVYKRQNLYNEFI